MINRERKFIVTMFIRCMKCEKSKKIIRELHILNYVIFTKYLVSKITSITFKVLLFILKCL